MTRIKRARPALIVAVLALIAAVAGTALAGPTADTSKPARTIAKIAKKKAKKALNKAKANAALLEALCGRGASAAGSATCLQITTVTRRGPTVTVNVNRQGSSTASCNAGERATGGGFSLDGQIADAHVFRSKPDSGVPPTQWTAQAFHGSAFQLPFTITAYVVCAFP